MMPVLFPLLMIKKRQISQKRQILLRGAGVANGKKGLKFHKTYSRK
jgi:hypothetical protein